jgi:hypothetical protein
MPGPKADLTHPVRCKAVAVGFRLKVFIYRGLSAPGQRHVWLDEKDCISWENLLSIFIPISCRTTQSTSANFM